MAKLWAIQIADGKKSISDVPAKLKEQVQALLEVNE